MVDYFVVNTSQFDVLMLKFLIYSAILFGISHAIKFLR